VKVLLADDHELMRDGLASALLETFPGTEIIEAEEGEEILRHLENHPDFDLVLLDLYMPNTDGFELLRNICDNYLDMRVVVISASEDVNDMHKVIDYGAAGFLPKISGRQVMMSALQLVLSGGVYIPTDMLAGIYSKRSQQDNHLVKAERPLEPHSDLDQSNIKLTHRQMDVLQLLIDGESNKSIARNLGLAENTVKIHVASIFKSLGVANRTQAALEAQKLGLFD
jgi:DNA-binding NarL/FixJ family response regulator